MCYSHNDIHHHALKLDVHCLGCKSYYILHLGVTGKESKNKIDSLKKPQMQIWLENLTVLIQNVLPYMIDCLLAQMKDFGEVLI